MPLSQHCAPALGIPRARPRSHLTTTGLRASPSMERTAPTPPLRFPTFWTPCTPQVAIPESHSSHTAFTHQIQRKSHQLLGVEKPQPSDLIRVQATRLRVTRSLRRFLI